MYAETRAGIHDSFSLGAGLKLRKRVGWLTISLGLLGVTVGYVRLHRKEQHETPHDSGGRFQHPLQ